MYSICLFSPLCPKTQDKITVWQRNCMYRAGTRYRQGKAGHTVQPELATYELEIPNWQICPQPPPTPSLAMTAVSISRYELLFVRTNQHFHVGPIIAALIGSGGNMQDCILVVCPSRKAFPKHHMLPVLGPAEEGEAKLCPVADSVLPEKYCASCLGWMHSFSPHRPSLARLCRTVSKRPLLYLPASL